MQAPYRVFSQASCAVVAVVSNSISNAIIAASNIPCSEWTALTSEQFAVSQQTAIFYYEPIPERIKLNAIKLVDGDVIELFCD